MGLPKLSPSDFLETRQIHPSLSVSLSLSLSPPLSLSVCLSCGSSSLQLYLATLPTPCFFGRGNRHDCSTSCVLIPKQETEQTELDSNKNREREGGREGGKVEREREGGSVRVSG